MSFVTPDQLRELPHMTGSEIDALPFGCVRVDDSGRVQRYNRYEFELVNIAQIDAVGRNFFQELAPFTNNRLVFGRFKDGIASGSLDAEITYAFSYKMRPALVVIHLYRDPNTKTNWVMIKRVGDSK